MNNSKCPICENEEINQEDNYCKICGHKFEKQLIAEIARNNDESITARIVKSNASIYEVVAGMIILLDIVVTQSEKNVDEVFEIMREIREKKIEREENQDASK
ncbi:MAG: hypothetical protein HFJ30_10335 [Clostridia bacterium]|jgi:hypothetical protein|nr:hypothetical protein [Clostridia bacterium]